MQFDEKNQGHATPRKEKTAINLVNATKIFFRYTKG